MQGTVRFEEIGPERNFDLQELQERANHNAWNKNRKQYRVWSGDRQVAFVTFDTCWEDELNLYEVFVARQYRGQVIGTVIVQFAADLGKQMGKPRLTIRARPLSDQSQSELIAWYVRRGLIPREGEPEFLVMELSPQVG